MPQETLVLIVVGALVVGLLAWIGLTLRRTQMLRARFGPEYEHLARTVEQWGRGEDVSTEELRVALRRYRAFFDRLLSI
jgi:uncharacterized membrane protein YccC